MQLHEQYGLTRVINARGTFTPLGVSRSAPTIAAATAAALQDFFVIDELQAAVSSKVAAYCGAEAAAVTHCVSAAITLAVAAAMTGGEAEKTAALPDADAGAMPNRVVLPAGHAVDYGHPIEQDIRLAGASSVLAGSRAACTPEQLEQALAHPRTACLLLVSSRLVQGEPVDLAQAVALAHQRGVPAIIDGAAQDMRLPALLETGADLVLVSAHKYLASPTAGLVIGRREMVSAVRAQEKGIGRAMKATKEALVGVLAAVEERERIEPLEWRRTQDEKLARFLERLKGLRGVRAQAVADPAGMPFARASLVFGEDNLGPVAAEVAQRLRADAPPIWVMDHNAARGELILELVALNDSEIDLIAERIIEILE